MARAGFLTFKGFAKNAQLRLRASTNLIRHQTSPLSQALTLPGETPQPTFTLPGDRTEPILPPRTDDPNDALEAYLFALRSIIQTADQHFVHKTRLNNTLAMVRNLPIPERMGRRRELTRLIKRRRRDFTIAISSFIIEFDIWMDTINWMTFFWWQWHTLSPTQVQFNLIERAFLDITLINTVRGVSIRALGDITVHDWFRMLPIIEQIIRDQRDMLDIVEEHGETLFDAREIRLFEGEPLE
jgi:hypothetical protein